MIPDDDRAQEHARRREQMGKDIRVLQEEMGHEGPMPAFLNIISERLVDYQMRIEELEEIVKGSVTPTKIIDVELSDVDDQASAAARKLIEKEQDG